jgi:hypothetical protein
MSGHTTEMRIKEHQWHIHHAQPFKSMVAEHNNKQVLANKSGYMDRLNREAIKLALHLNNINRKNGLLFSRSWKSLSHLL